MAMRFRRSIIRPGVSLLRHPHGALRHHYVVSAPSSLRTTRCAILFECLRLMLKKAEQLIEG